MIRYDVNKKTELSISNFDLKILKILGEGGGGDMTQVPGIFSRHPC